MGASWVAGVTRAQAMAHRCVGVPGAHVVAAESGLTGALRYLGGTAYGRGLDPGHSLADAQRSVSATLLWHLRVLAGWQPQRGTQVIRLLAADFEIANTAAHLRLVSGAELSEGWRPYRLGALATAWPRLAVTRSPGELRAVLAGSAWGDPGADSAAAVAVGMRVSAATRTAATVPEAARWGAGRVALLVAREVFLLRRRLTGPSTRRAAGLLGTEALAADSFAEFRRHLPARAKWSLSGIDDVSDVWRAEARWWHEVGRRGAELIRGSSHDSARVVGAAAVLAADAWRVRGALELAARGGGGSEVLDAAS